VGPARTGRSCGRRSHPAPAQIHAAMACVNKRKAANARIEPQHNIRARGHNTTACPPPLPAGCAPPRCAAAKSRTAWTPRKRCHPWVSASKEPHAQPAVLGCSIDEACGVWCVALCGWVGGWVCFWGREVISVFGSGCARAATCPCRPPPPAPDTHTHHDKNDDTGRIRTCALPNTDLNRAP
jgi:hypothetical protein